MKERSEDRMKENREEKEEGRKKNVRRWSGGCVIYYNLMVYV